MSFLETIAGQMYRWMLVFCQADHLQDAETGTSRTKLLPKSEVSQVVSRLLTSRVTRPPGLRMMSGGKEKTARKEGPWDGVGDYCVGPQGKAV